MENSVESIMEMKLKKTKLQVEDVEVKIKAKRELESKVITINRAIRDATSEIQKLTEEQTELTKTTEKLQGRLFVDTAHLDALTQHVKASHEYLKELRKLSDSGVTKVWALRSSLSEAVQNVADECDTWALLRKPRFTDHKLPRTSKKTPENNRQEFLNEGRLKIALERREKAIAERRRLETEPETGEEFLRKLLVAPKYRLYCSKVEACENGPVKFTTSAAAKKRTVPVMRKPDTNIPWYQPYSVVASVSVFLLYFCILREENDMDLEFDKTLYERIKGLEKEQLLQSYKFNKEHGMSVEDIENRLKELEELEAKAVS